MQITVTGTDESVSHTLTLRADVLPPESDCELCDNEPSVWSVESASPEAMDPELSAVGAARCGAACLNKLIADGAIVVTALDPYSF